MYLIIDGNSIGHAALHSRKLTIQGEDGEEMETQAIFQSLRTIKSLKEKYQDDYPKLLVLWDCKAHWRINLDDQYKANRKDTQEKVVSKNVYAEQMPFLINALTMLGVDQVHAEDFEADDLAGFFVRRALKKKRKVMLITGDQDWLQLVGTHVSWHDPRNSPGKFCDRATFQEFTGFVTTDQFLVAKAILGDSSDNIRGINGLGAKAVLGIMNNFGGVPGLREAHSKCGGEFQTGDLPKDLSRFRKNLNEFLTPAGLSDLKRNINMMNLKSPVRDAQMKERIKIDKGEKDMEAFELFCHHFKFLSIARHLPAWSKLF